MRKTCEERFLNCLEKIQLLPQNQLCNGSVLILDQVTSKLISPLIKTSALFEHGIRSITKSTVKKKPQQDASCIYFISENSIENVFEDFAKKSIYYSINLLICQTASNQLMQKISNHENIIERLASFGELHMNTIYQNQYIALLNEQNVLQSVFKKDLNQAKRLANELMISVISGFGNKLRLNIYYHSCNFCQNVAKELEKQLIQKEMLERQNDSIELQLIIVDRKYDLLSPVIHSFHFYPMLIDLLKVQNCLNPSFLIQKNQLSISLDDKVFNQYKYMHINNVLNVINPDLKKFTSQNKAAKFQKGLANNNNLKQVIKQIPQYNAIVKSYNDHLNIMQELININKNQNLTEIVQLEHTIISNLNAKGEPQKDKKLVTKVFSTLQQLKQVKLKVRLIFIAVLALQMSDGDRNKLLKQLQALQYKQLVKILTQIRQKNPIKLPLLNKQSRKNLFLDRHYSKLQCLFDSLVNNNIPKQFKLISINQEQYKAQKFQKIDKVIPKDNKKWVLFMLGGICVNEISQVGNALLRKSFNSFNIITDTVFSAESYVSQLSKLK